MPPSPLVWRSPRWRALAKPAGLPVFPPHADPSGDCLLRRLLAVAPEAGAAAWPAGFSGGIAHRLDVSTSGQVLAAATPQDLSVLRAAFSAKALRKRYRFVTARDVPWSTHTVSHRLAHDRRKKRRMTFERGRDTPHRGKWMEAETDLQRVGPLAGGLWLWEARMRTGVMHQIRVHAAAAGLALVGDRLYGGGPPLPGLPPGVAFLLHHVGLTGPGLDPPAQPVPDWWPRPR